MDRLLVRFTLILSGAIFAASVSTSPAQIITQIIDSTGDGAGNALQGPRGIAVDALGNVYMGGANSGNAFRITPSGVITEIIDSTGDGAGNMLSGTFGMDIDAAGNVYVSGFNTNNAFKITPGGVITEIFDSAGDGAGNTIANASALAVDGAGNVYVAGTNSNNAFKITPGGVITEIIDTSLAGVGNAFNNPFGIAVDGSGNVYVAVTNSDNAFKITPGGVITEIIDATGDGAGNTLDGTFGIAVDGSSNVYVTGNLSNNVFKITPGGVITEIIDANGDGAGNTLGVPLGVTVDGSGNVYVAGTDTNNAFKITPGGMITEVIDSTGDGAGNPFNVPFEHSIAVDGAGNVYVTGGGSNNAFKIVASPQRFVRADIPIGGDGTSWNQAFKTLQDALIDAAGSGGGISEIWVAAGTYTPDAKNCTVDGDCTANGGGTCPAGVCVWTTPRAQTFQLLNGITIYGGFIGTETSLDQRDISANETILSGDLAANDVPDLAGLLRCFSGDGTPLDAEAGCTPFDADFDGDVDALDGNIDENSYHVTDGSNKEATAVLNGFTVTAGNADFTGDPNSGKGGGIIVLNGGPSLETCRFSTNTALVGGGVAHVSTSTTNVRGCTFVSNLASQGGGGLYAAPVGMGQILIDECTFSDNRAHIGGAIRSFLGLTVTNSTFTGNVATLWGGAIDQTASTGNFVSCAFVSNNAFSSGGALRIANGEYVLSNCSFVGNITEGLGGAMYCANAPLLSITNCEFSANIAGNQGGALFVHETIFSVTATTVFRNSAGSVGGGIRNNGLVTTLLLRNGLLWQNSDSSGITLSSQVFGGTSDVAFSCVQDAVPNDGNIPFGGILNGNIDVDPLFVDADGPDNIPGTEDDDLRLRPGSPAIDAGDTNALPLDEFDLDGDGDFAELIPIDLAGHPRVRDDDDTFNTGIPGPGGVVDMGAFELYNDCDNDGLLDEDEIASDPGLDCNNNGILDVCEIDENSVAPGGPFFCMVDCDADCNGNGIPDDCDIANCGVDGPFDPSCDDCNLNGVPDGCDDPIDSIPDECVEPTVVTLNWSDGLNWPLSGDFPDNDPANPNGAPALSVTLDGADDLLVDVDITVDTLRLLDGAVLRVTQGGAARMTQAGTAGDFAIALPGGIQSSGTILVDHDRAVDASAGVFLLSGAGKYVADPSGTGTLSASLTAGSVELLHSPIPRLEQLTLIDGMNVTSLGSFVMDGAGSCNCPFTPPECPPDPAPGAARRGGPTPPIARVRDVALFVAGVENGSSIRVEADFVIECVAKLCIGCEDAPDSPIATVELLGSFVNRSVTPSIFRWLNGRLLLSGFNARTFEAGGIDFGMSLEGFSTEVDALHDPCRPETCPHSNFAMGTMELAPGASLEFVNRELNTVGNDACDEALYIDELILGDNSTVTATGTRVYYAKLTSGENTTIGPHNGCGAVCPLLNAPATDAVPKNRFLSILGSNPGRQTAFQITLVDLPPPHDLWNGFALWVGPTSQVNEAGAVVVPTEGSPSFTAATLQCTPFFADWSQEGAVHVFHEAIVPGATYEIREIEEQCSNPPDARNFSPSTPITTSIWGDTVLDLSVDPPLPPGGPPVDVVDALAVLERFVSDPSAIIKARADLEPNCLDLKINVTDVLASLSGFSGLPYPFAPTAADPCNSTCPNLLP